MPGARKAVSRLHQPRGWRVDPKYRSAGHGAGLHSTQLVHLSYSVDTMIAYPDEPNAAGRPPSSATCDCVGEQAEQLQGPIPSDWLATAAHLPGKSLHVGIALWHAAGLQNARTVLLSNVAAHRFAIDRNAKYRGLNWLEEARLIRVERRIGRSPRVTILHRGTNNGGQD